VGTTREVVGPRANRMTMPRLRRELVAGVELWLLPLFVALLPYRAGIALARWAARTISLYDTATEASVLEWSRVTGREPTHEWRAAYRLEQLVDHADLFWSLTRRSSPMLRKLRVPALELPAGRPLVVISYHYGQGLWLLHWLATLDHPPRFVSMRISRDDADSTLQYAYARLRNRQVARVANAQPIYTGGARAAIADTLASGGTVYGLIDVPASGARAARPGNGTMFGRPVSLPSGLLESARASDAAVLVLSGRLDRDGSRVVEARLADRADAIAIGDVARELEARLASAPAAWHFWHLWPGFEVAD
jgi:phosphatidylinositol dimannoside acyltransferase